MRTVCQISGEVLSKADYGLGFDLGDIHPIFKAKASLILRPDTIHRFRKANSPIEKKLYFLAVLNSTGLVTFRCAANPSLFVCEKYFYCSIELCEWIVSMQNRGIAGLGFPQLVIDPINADLHSINGWLEAIAEIRKQLANRDLKQIRIADWHQRSDDIRKELANAYLDNQLFTPKIAKWALELAGVSRNSDLWGFWQKLMCVPENDAWIYRMEDFQELQEEFFQNLPQENPDVILVMAQMRKLINACKRGFTEMTILGDDPDKVTGFEFVEEETGTVHKINQHLINVPTDKPQEKDFKRRIDYIVATARWNISQEQKAKQAQAAQQIVKDSKSIGEQDV